MQVVVPFDPRRPKTRLASAVRRSTPASVARRRSRSVKPDANEGACVKRIISTEDAPAAVGAYSQATTNDDLVFTAGQIPFTPEGESLADEPIATQTERALTNVEAVLAEEGLDMGDVLKTTILLDDIDDFDEMNETYSEFFDDEPPARSAFEVANLPKGVGVEIEAIATQ
jgi:reactive intermediate/imine deaminase